MANYLLHQRADGTPVGVFTATSHFYLASAAPLHEAYGVRVVKGKRPGVEWEEWIDRLSDSLPTATAMWTVYPHEEAPLEDVLMDARADTSYD